MKFELFIITHFSALLAITLIALINQTTYSALISIITVISSVFIISILTIAYNFARYFKFNLERHNKRGSTYSIQNHPSKWSSDTAWTDDPL